MSMLRRAAVGLSVLALGGGVAVACGGEQSGQENNEEQGNPGGESRISTPKAQPTGATSPVTAVPPVVTETVGTLPEPAETTETQP